MFNKSTQYLNNVLNDTKSKAGLNEYLKSLEASDDPDSLSEYFNHIIATKQLVTADIIRESNLSKDYAYQILSGRKDKPTRTKVIALCIGCHMNLQETQRALEISRNGILYARDSADAIVIYHINSEIWSVLKINEALHEQGLPLIE